MEPVVEHVVGRPAGALRPFVAGYIGYRQERTTPRLHRGLPSRHLTVVLSLDRPLDIAAMPDPAQLSGSWWALAGGLHSAPVLIADDGSQRGVQLELTPGGARALFGLPAGELASTVVDLGELLGGRAAELSDRLHAANSWPARFEIVDEIFTRSLTDTPQPAPEVAEAWRRIVSSAGTVEIGTLARDVGWSRRHLGERFRLEFGLSPKAAARVARFERARRLLARPRRPELAEIAAVCGYYDQAHLNREWRELAGCSPTTWLAEELPFVQDSADTREAS